MNIVLLPGLDGTGELFARFQQALSSTLHPKTVVYPFKDGLGYDVLTEYVHDVVPTDQPFILLGESFSGPIAVTVAADNMQNLKGLILVNTFLENPSPLLLKLSEIVPNKFLTQPPIKMLQWMLKNAEREAVDAKELLSTVSSLSPELIRSRLASVAKVDVRAHASRVSVPVCVMQSTCDVAISTRAAKNLVRAFSNSSVQRFDTNHFLLQAMPNSAARTVDLFVDSYCS